MGEISPIDMVQGAFLKRGGTREASLMVMSRAGAGNLGRANKIRASLDPLLARA